MIKIDKYCSNFEEEYWEIVNSKIASDVQEKIIKESKAILPEDFYTGPENPFKQLILAPFSKLKNAYMCMDEMKVSLMKESGGEHIREPFKTLHAAYSKVVGSEKNKVKLRVRMVKEMGLTVCPYCNRDYINCRKEDVSGAQLDHFYCRNTYPIFSVCLYNLVPVCGTCNRIKSASTEELVSPFDEKINWEDAVVFSYNPDSEKRGEVVITTKDGAIIENNIKLMQIREAYEIHDKDVCELLDKKEAYSASQMEEFKMILGENNITVTDAEIKRLVFGPEITLEAMKTKPLGKMMHDLHKELDIY